MIATADAKAGKRSHLDHPFFDVVVGLGAVVGMVGGVLGALLGLLFAGSLIDAYVFAQLWRWFALPLGLPALTYWTTVGLLLLVRFARPIESAPEREGDGKVKTPLANFIMRVVLYPAIVWGFGAFVHHMTSR